MSLAQAPSRGHVVGAIARRELAISFRRRLVKLLFITSLGPPLVFAGILVVRLVAQRTAGFDLDWDPVLWFLRIQALPVALLAVGIGAPLVSRDRAEDVLYLYAVRPVTPWTYTAGKLLAVALPSFLLMMLPAVIIVGLRQGLLDQQVGAGESLSLLLRVTLSAVFVAAGYAGVTVGPSALAARSRWALLIIFLFFWLPDLFAALLWGPDALGLSPGKAAQGLLDSLVGGRSIAVGAGAAAVLAAYAILGALVTSRRVRKEMIP
jgi:hypothetical protein